MSMILNAAKFRGVFPHKGRLCARMKQNWGPDRWIPVPGRQQGIHFELAHIVGDSLMHLPLRSVHPQDRKDLQVLTVRSHWPTAIVDGRLKNVEGPPERVTTVAVPRGRWIRIVTDYKTEVCNGPDRARVTVAAPAAIRVADSGCAALAGAIWVKRG